MSYNPIHHHCGPFNSMLPVAQGVLDGICRQHDQLYQRYLDKGMDPYLSRNKADEFMMRRLRNELHKKHIPVTERLMTELYDILMHVKTVGNYFTESFIENPVMELREVPLPENDVNIANKRPQSSLSDYDPWADTRGWTPGYHQPYKKPKYYSSDLNRDDFKTEADYKRALADEAERYNLEHAHDDIQDPMDVVVPVAKKPLGVIDFGSFQWQKKVKSLKKFKSNVIRRYAVLKKAKVV